MSFEFGVSKALTKILPDCHNGIHRVHIMVIVSRSDDSEACFLHLSSPFFHLPLRSSLSFER